MASESSERCRDSTVSGIFAIAQRKREKKKERERSCLVSSTCLRLVPGFVIL